ncbi:VanW family protein [Cellulomonas sp. NPDC089187]|uniref:VanW family protein n=1 Tax=Cellulomonas sp. NPDC089187 TaxID=3154970 RepID=UPI00342CFE3D
MGQGNADGSAPEDTTADAPQGKADTTATSASPNVTAPVPQPNDTGERPTGDADVAEQPGDDAPAPDADESAADVDEPVTDLDERDTDHGTPDTDLNAPAADPDAAPDEDADAPDQTPAAPVRTPVTERLADEPSAQATATDVTASLAEPVPEGTPATETTTVLPVAAPATPDPVADDESDATPSEGSPLDVFESEPTGQRRWWRPVLIVAGVLVVLGGAYVGGAYALADRVPRGTTVAGIEVGGMTADDARTALSDGLSERSNQAIAVIAREVSGSVDPATAGLSLDVDATVNSLTGVDLRPQRMWQHIAGGGEESPVTTVDEAKLDAALEELSGALTLAPVDGSVVFVDGAPQGVDAVDGWSLDQEGARSTLEDGWLTEAMPIELPSDTVEPAITQDEVDRVVRDVASAVVSGPVTVGVAGQNAELPVDVLVAAASFVPEGDQLVLQMDGAALVEQVVSRTSNLLTDSADARFEFQDGAPVIVPGTPGTTLDPAALGTAVTTAASSTDERTASVELVSSDPAQSTQALEELGVKEVISEFSTPLTSESRRTQNISAGAAAINGTLVRPGETFSLTDALGPIDAAHGFVQAGAIVNGEHSDAWGGGLSQLSTTTFNAAFEAGMEDTDHTPHSEWFQRYPAGREATLYTGSIDMQWKNTTPYGVLVQSYVADGKTWVRLWSTPYYEVSITSGEKTNVVSPTTVYNTSASCSPQSAGNPGFSIQVTRTISLNGEVQSTDNLSWRYKAQNRVVCGADPATQPPAPEG